MIDDDGMVRYLAKDYAKVQGIIRTVEFGPDLQGDVYGSRVLLSDEEKKYILSRLENRSISYQFISNIGGYEVIEWSDLHSLDVYQIIQGWELSSCNKTTGLWFVNDIHR